MGDGNEAEKGPLLANETCTAYSEDVIGKFNLVFCLC